MQSIILAFADKTMATKINDVLCAAGINVDSIYSSGSQALAHAVYSDACLVICSFSLKDMSAIVLHSNLPKSSSMLLISKQNIDFARSNGIFTLSPPINKTSFVNTVNMMCESEIHWQKENDLRPKRTGEDKATIEQAKELLMIKFCISEPQAHEYLQKRSMINGWKMVMTAKQIIHALT